MANYIVNIAATNAIRKDTVISLEVIQIENGTYVLLIKTTGRGLDVKFETDATLQGIQAKAATVLAALEE